jgi:hypothetical protein
MAEGHPPACTATVRLMRLELVEQKGIEASTFELRERFEIRN